MGARRTDLLVALVALHVSTIASASVVATTLGALDTETGLEWLRLTATQGQSYDSIQAGYGGLVTTGWRYASVDEVVGLFLNSGANADGLVNGSPMAASAQAAKLLIDLLGYTVDASNDGGDTYFARGLTSIRTPMLPAFMR